MFETDTASLSTTSREPSSRWPAQSEAIVAVVWDPLTERSSVVSGHSTTPVSGTTLL